MKITCNTSVNCRNTLTHWRECREENPRTMRGGDMAQGNRFFFYYSWKTAIS